MIPNPLGSARGLHYSLNNTSVYAMPGVPNEMKSMMLRYVIPNISKKIKKVLYIKTLKTIGKGESLIAEQIQPLIDTHSDFCSIAYLPQISGVDIRISSSDNKQFETLLKKLKKELGICVYGEDDDTLENITGKLLIEKDMTIAVAESCTGGLLNHHFTSVSGSSKYMKGGVVAYSNEIKRDILGVQEKTLAKFGAVSKETAIELAVGIRQKLFSEIGISITGIAGPTGGTYKKPIGLVFIGFSKKNYKFFKKYLFHGDRKSINYRTTKVAIDIVRRELIHE
jgi:nicotinamide-nucleotide amidase